MVNFSSFTSQQNTAMTVTLFVLCVLYVAVLCCMIYNIYNFLYKAQFFKITGVSFFYAFASSALLLRIGGYLSIIVSYTDTISKAQQIFWQFNTLATMLMIAIGFQVSKNMCELAILLQPETDRTDSKLKTLTISTFVTFGCMLIIEIYLSIETAKYSNQQSADLTDFTFKKRTYSVLLFNYLLVSCVLVVGYLLMSSTLNNFNSTMILQQKSMIKSLFFIAIMFYLLACLFYSMALIPRKFLSTTFARDYICIWTWPIFDLPVIMSIFWLHYRSFGQQVRDGELVRDYGQTNNQRKVWTNYTTMQEQMMQLEIQGADNLKSRPDVSQFYVEAQNPQSNIRNQKLILAAKPYYQNISIEIKPSQDYSKDSLEQTDSGQKSNLTVKSSSSKLTDYQAQVSVSLNSQKLSSNDKSRDYFGKERPYASNNLSEFENIAFVFRASAQMSSSQRIDTTL